MTDDTARVVEAPRHSGSFASLQALQEAHEGLLETADTAAEGSPAEAAARERRIADYIRRAVATGAILDAPADRRTAQRFIDYWVASSYTSERQEAAEGGTSPRNRYSRPTRLAPFDTHLIKEVEQQGEQILAKLKSKDLELARRILMHLVRLEPTGACVVVPTKRLALLALGKVQVARTILKRLIEARVLKETPSEGGDVVELQHDALTRKWDRLARWIDERIKFREAALFWDRSGRKRGALLGLGVAKEAEAYGDLNELELEFLSESKRNSAIFAVAAVIAAVLLVAIPQLYGPLYRVFWVPLWAESVTEDVRSKTSSARTKSDGIRWLARNDQPLAFPGISLVDVDLSNVVLQRPGFSSAELIGVNFNNAQIESGRFGEATIARTTFVNARLYGSSFDGALFCEGVDFSDTDLRATTFVNVEFEKDTAPIVKNTAWWLAQGWSWEQMQLLRTQDRSDVQKSRGFKQAMTEAERMVQTSNRLVRAFALNEKAWILAIFGIELDHAESAAREALNIIPGGSTVEGSIRDTLGYILLQKGDKTQAMEQLELAVKLDPSPEHLFRHAVAQLASGRQDSGIAQLKRAMAAKNFTPNHELVLLRTHISGKFETELKSNLEARQPPGPRQPQSQASPPGRKCPPLPARPNN